MPFCSIEKSVGNMAEVDINKVLMKNTSAHYRIRTRKDVYTGKEIERERETGRKRKREKEKKRERERWKEIEER